MANWTKIDETVKKWIQEAGENIRASFTHSISIQAKSNPNDLVTNVDEETERFFIEQIRTAFPDHRILGEEGQGDDVQSLDGVIWIIDPIDGTMNFVHQQRNFAISIGIYEDGVGQLGYIYDIVHDELYHAKKGQGAWMNDVLLEKLEKVPVETAIIGISATWLVNNRHFDQNRLIGLAKDVRGTRSYGSAALELAYVASGRLSAYITMRNAPWDFAGGKIIVEEAGGIVSTIGGEDLNMLSVNPVFAAAPGLHEDILKKYLNKKGDG
ncbi:inositol monophosphatase family protein [Domibacillus sp. A3M-37]|uniref:inositol monophosphatase family protein n=1 Tax=Domibacillus sp. A3M-37 TaxID=2962037 RepID=UPI0020B79E62|nr:inositol monophosphatase family protein [Domibacillus sp. A3M-37]MCP3761863.1 inositol monophosphatase family protein [Domibacillus sp. A3M-37]